jgi:hypothetical protein
MRDFPSRKLGKDREEDKERKDKTRKEGAARLVFAPAMEELIGFERLCIARSSSIISARTSEESLHPHSARKRALF